MRLADFDYHLPASAIAQTPAEPRDAARLLVAGDPPIDSHFAALADHLQAGDLLVVNATRVRAARLTGTRPTGGKIELLLLRPDGDAWDALARPSRKLRPGMQLGFDGFEMKVQSVGEEGRVRVTFGDEAGTSAETLVAQTGRVPYPPYIVDGPDDAERYQTVYGSTVGSAAAPTAGLHFTTDLLADLADRGIARAEIFLDIGLDTFRPITADRLDEHVMHTERYDIPAATAGAVAATRRAGGRVVAVGTTVVRTLESAAGGEGRLATGEGTTDLFIRPGYTPKVVDALLTNFHMPRSSLIVMIAALVPGWRRLYEHALGRGYRFLSFGDAMLVGRLR